MIAQEKLYHVTVLSNFARGFDKYSQTYSKSRIPESTYPNQFFLLRRDELGIGIEKAGRLLEKIGITGNRLLVLKTRQDSESLCPNIANGRGQFIRSDGIVISGLYELAETTTTATQLQSIAVEDAMATSLQLLKNEFRPFAQIRPRAISFLPVALACQARCPFCFSKASVSSDQIVAKPDWQRVSDWLDRARKHGAERAVITGGGEPTLLSPALLQQLISACAHQFEKIVLITNGYTLAATTGTAQVNYLENLYDSGLRVLAISRHHFEAKQNERLMNLDVPIESLIRTWHENRQRWPELRLRLISVLQAGGVDNNETLENYLSWAVGLGVTEICFKELYVSTSAESIYHDRLANEWSRGHQVSLSLVTRFAEAKGFVVESRLPWGAPVYQGEWRGRSLRVAAYTEPSLFWERTQGVARSWNVMANGRCHVSLEDRASEISLEEMS